MTRAGPARAFVLVLVLVFACDAPRTVVTTWAPEPTPEAGRSGYIESVTEIASPRSAFGAIGIIVGAVLGALLVPDDTMLLGAMVGGATGLAVGPTPSGGEHAYRVAVRFDDGATAVFECRARPSFRAGDVIAVRDGELARAGCVSSDTGR